MAIIEGRPTDRSGKPLYGPVRLNDPEDGNNITTDDYVMCRGAKAVFLHLYCASGAQTYAQFNTRMYTDSDTTLTAVSTEGGLTLDGTTGSTVAEGTVVAYYPTAGPRIAAYAVGLQFTTSAAATGNTVDAYIEW